MWRVKAFEYSLKWLCMCLCFTQPTIVPTIHPWLTCIACITNTCMHCLAESLPALDTKKKKMHIKSQKHSSLQSISVNPADLSWWWCFQTHCQVQYSLNEGTAAMCVDKTWNRPNQWVSATLSGQSTEIATQVAYRFILMEVKTCEITT